MTRADLATGLLALIVAACSPVPSADPSSAAVASPSMPPPAMRTSTTPVPSPSSLPLLDLETLPVVHLEDSGATSICDLDPSAFGDVFCYDGLDFGHRALRTVMASIDRLYLNRPACAGGACIPDEVNRVRVIGWSGDEAYSVLIDWDDSTITVPTAGAAAPWPSASSSLAPPIRRPSFDNVPAEIRQRESYPFCGRAKPIGFRDDKPEVVARVYAINRCFFDAVLDGRPAEMIHITAVTEQPALFRFGDRGR